MKCKMCKGKGKLKTYYRGQKDYVKCEMCNGTGEVSETGKVEQTEQEFMQSCTMEELGCFICEKLMHGACGECKFMKPIDGRHTCGLREWLKQPHTIKE